MDTISLTTSAYFANDLSNKITFRWYGTIWCKIEGKYIFITESGPSSYVYIAKSGTIGNGLNGLGDIRDDWETNKDLKLQRSLNLFQKYIAKEPYEDHSCI